ncbi:MAG: hypothetical protein LBG59_04065 [Candidatus Peribacteria bacterium]|nr:hypothetical protein [Candidatus Peribacteria bacterium]
MYQNIRKVYYDKLKEQEDEYKALSDLQQETNTELMKQFCNSNPYREVDGEIVAPHDDPTYEDPQFQETREKRWEDGKRYGTDEKGQTYFSFPEE